MSSTDGKPSIRPLFLMSLPRSGSTLAQRVLGAHPQIATASEPWILLPLVYARRENGVRAEYCHMVAAQAIQDFAEARNGGTAAFEDRLRDFVEGVYEDAAGSGASYFLDKTPHYHLIADELLRLFPSAKFLFLWRNPLAVLASFLESFRLNRFEPYLYRPEFTRGQSLLTKAFDENRDRAHAARFEDLLGPDSERHWRGVFEYLELPWDPNVLHGFAEVNLQGRAGDLVGPRRYRTLSQEPLEKWRDSLRGPIRQAWTAQLIDEMAPSLQIMGYDPDALVRDLRAAGPAPAGAVARDAVWLTRSAMQRFVTRSAIRMPDMPRMLGEAWPPLEPLPQRVVSLVRSFVD
jgi:Sulfotransferase family